jgi:molybdopterin-guanine dinucleotide biosynthesis protein A
MIGPSNPSVSLGDLTGLILAGGKSRRMGGRNKAFLELDGRPLIEIVIERMQSVCGEVVIVAGDPGPYAGLGVPVIEDRFRGVGVLGGMHAGLEAASHELALVVGCDMPFLNPGLLRAFAAWATGCPAGAGRAVC